MSKDNGRIDESCFTCGTTVSVNNVIDNEDLTLALDYSGEGALSEATAKRDEIAKRFTQAQTALIADGDRVRLQVEFSCGAEKVIFLMAQRARS
jgi:uncharacterized protein YfcZ (UPF0381/DUF406 family)